MMSSRVEPERKRWNTRYNWIIALIAMAVAGALIFLYQWFWLPKLFAGLLASGLPGEDEGRVYTLTIVFFALPGVVVALATLLWRLRPSRFSRSVLIVVASAWFILVSPSGVGRPGTSGGAGVRRDIFLRAGADPSVADSWGDALHAGALIGLAIGLAAGVVAILRSSSVSRRRKMTAEKRAE